ncbi:MAG: phage major tail protein, TP901-1 family [Pseudomonadota bacterium]
MAAQRGKDILLKILDQASGNYVTVAGLRTKRLAFNQQSVDITDAESAGQWRELLSGSGIRRLAISASGIFKDKSSDELVRRAFFSGTLMAAEIVIPDFGTLQTPLLITSLEYAGNHDSEMTFDTLLESGGEVTFVAHS